MPSEPRAQPLPATPPASWPAPPREFSFSSLAAVERCPRQWALEHAAYPEVWDGRGYPPRGDARRLAGRGVHAALDELTRALANAGLQNVRTPGAVEVLTAAGGLSAALARAVAQEVERAVASPRVAARRRSLERALESRFPELRATLQRLLARVDGLSRAGGGAAGAGVPRLGRGANAEVRVRSSRVGLLGKVDLITITESDVELREFKTGARDDGHSDQLHLYALLWLQDAGRNPDARPATRLVLSYPDGDQQAPTPTPGDLALLEDRVRARVAAARSVLETTPPVAAPAVEKCASCDVRHLCDEYWASLPTREQEFVDIEVEILSWETPTSAVISARLPGAPDASEAHLRGADAGVLPVGQRARALRVLASAEEGGRRSFVLTRASELFVRTP